TSIINGGRQQQYHRPLLRPDETSNTGTLNSYDGKENKQKESVVRPNEQPLSESLPYENYRTTTIPTSTSRPTTTTTNDGTTNLYPHPSQNTISTRNNNNNTTNSAGANRLSDDEYEREEVEGDEERDNEHEDDDNDVEKRLQRLTRKENGQTYSQTSMLPTIMADNFSRNNIP
ncbi:unnamed protein product, partial [Adineta steineri]